MRAKILVLIVMTSISGCVLTTNDALEDLHIGMTIVEAEAILGAPTTVRALRTVEGTTPAKNIERECRTYRYVYDDENAQTSRTDRFTWVTYNAGHVAEFSDNGYAHDDQPYCHG